MLCTYDNIPGNDISWNPGIDISWNPGSVNGPHITGTVYIQHGK